MGIRIAPPEKVECKFEYWNSRAGIDKADGVALIVRPLNLDEISEYEDSIAGATSYKVNRRAGKGFRDRGQDPRSEVSYSIDSVKLRQLRRQRIRRALVGWEGFEAPDGSPLPYNWENFESACRTLPDLLDFADECVERASEEVYARLKSLQEAEKN